MIGLIGYWRNLWKRATPPADALSLQSPDPARMTMRSEEVLPGVVDGATVVHHGTWATDMRSVILGSYVVSIQMRQQPDEGEWHAG